ncbi:hypothetical protein AGR8A_Cc30190 [Agrobacterium fabrum str. J-07]|nr:hypothetical protein AGR8A_Cc30190 [Agrobacterium fabrum str. J-07]
MDIFSPITSGESLKRLCRLRFLEVSTGPKKSRQTTAFNNHKSFGRNTPKTKGPGIAGDPGPLKKMLKKSVLGGGKLCFQGLDAGAQRVVFIPRLNGHFANCVELLAPDDIQAVQPAIRLRMKSSLGFLAHALRRAGRIGHQLGEFIQKTIGACRAHGAHPSSVQGHRLARCC